MLTALASPADAVADRDRLIATYLAYLQAHPGAQSNGLDGAHLADVCTLWSQLQPSARAVFLTITSRLAGSHLPDGTSMLAHVTRLYRVVGGNGATATAAGSCGDGEANRMIMQEDATLLAAQLAANRQHGGSSSARPIKDANGTGFWRDSHDAAGPHTPFDTSDETNDGAPRGQTQYFADPNSPTARAPLGRQDLASLVDPFALEMDQDYDCAHNSNPECSYVFYGPLCFPRHSALGVDIYTASGYGAIDPSWKPTGC
jgi:hypothetical protein